MTPAELVQIRARDELSHDFPDLTAGAVGDRRALLAEVDRLTAQLEIAQSRHLPEYWSRMQEKSDGWFIESQRADRLTAALEIAKEALQDVADRRFGINSSAELCADALAKIKKSGA